MSTLEQHGYAVGLSKSIELAISRGQQDVGEMAAWIRAEWQTRYSPTDTEVRQERARLRRAGRVSYTPRDGWQLVKEDSHD